MTKKKERIIIAKQLRRKIKNLNFVDSLRIAKTIHHYYYSKTGTIDDIIRAVEKSKIKIDEVFDINIVYIPLYDDYEACYELNPKIKEISSLP